MPDLLAAMHAADGLCATLELELDDADEGAEFTWGDANMLSAMLMGKDHSLMSVVALSEVHLGREVSEALAPALGKVVAGRESEMALLLDGCHLGDAGVTALTSGMRAALEAAPPVGVFELDLSNNDIADEGMTAIARDLVKHVTTLQLSGNALRKGGVQALVDVVYASRLTKIVAFDGDKTVPKALLKSMFTINNLRNVDGEVVELILGDESKPSPKVADVDEDDEDDEEGDDDEADEEQDDEQEDKEDARPEEAKRRKAMAKKARGAHQLKSKHARRDPHPTSLKSAIFQEEIRIPQ